MRPLIIIVIFVGAFFIITGVYEQKLKIAQSKKDIEYKFIPRTYYDEQLNSNSIMDKLGSVFKNDSPWVSATIGESIDIKNDLVKNDDILQENFLKKPQLY